MIKKAIHNDIQDKSIASISTMVNYTPFDTLKI